MWERENERKRDYRFIETRTIYAAPNYATKGPKCVGKKRDGWL